MDMKKVAAVLMTGLLVVSFAWAKPLDFEDESFDFSDGGLETAYVTLEKNAEGGLQIDFSSEEAETAVATVDVEDQVQGYDTSDSTEVFWEESSLRANDLAANTLTDVDLDYRGNEFERVTLVHADQTYKEVQESYMAALEGLGFTLTPEEQTLESNTDIYTLESAGETLRVLFVNQGADTQVTFVQDNTL
jgi:hypothetical protein